MPMETLILATRNEGKIRELREVLLRFGFDVRGLPEDFPEIDENGSTFEENALIKARTVAAALGLPAVADDSGLEVDALGGAPGVRSARYSDELPAAGREDRDLRNNEKLLDALKDVPDGLRTARFRCCMAFVRPDGRHGDVTACGTWEGCILRAPRGTGGFGYDPLFLDPESGLTGGELSREEKNARSHRGKAVRLLLEKLEALDH